MTIREQIAAALEARGEHRVQSTSRRYWRYSRKLDCYTFYYLGKAGGLRMGHSMGDSISLTHMVPGILKRAKKAKRGTK